MNPDDLQTHIDNKFEYQLRLEEIANDEHLSLEELDALCWEDSSRVFNKIYD